MIFADGRFVATEGCRLCNLDLAIVAVIGKDQKSIAASFASLDARHVVLLNRQEGSFPTQNTLHTDIARSFVSFSEG
jgi:hypothetical protein